MAEILVQGTVAFFAAVGIAWSVWTAAGELFSAAGEPLEPFVALIPATRSARALERTVAALQWARPRGRPYRRVLIADCGLNAEGRSTARRLAAQSDRVIFCTMESVPGQLGAQHNTEKKE